MKINTQYLIGPALRYAVALAEGHTPIIESNAIGVLLLYLGTERGTRLSGTFEPDTNWSQGGPIIERAGIATRRHGSGTWYAMLSSELGDGERGAWVAFSWRGVKDVHRPGAQPRTVRFDGPTPLIAAMRCRAASKLGREVDVPEELAP